MAEFPKRTAEHLGTIRINNGQAAAELVRERDPGGATVVHAVRRSCQHAHERLHAAGKLVHELYDAAEKFRRDFERAQLSGNYARLDMFKTRAGRSEVSNGVALAKVRVNRALDAIGGQRKEPSFSQSCMWNVIGAGMTLDSWTHLIRSGGGAMNADKASGILHSTLERLALHYGLIDMGIHIGHPASPNAWGALINKAVRDGLLKATGGYRPMKQKTSHARKTAVYVFSDG